MSAPEDHLRQHTIDWWDAYEAAAERHEAQQQEVVMVGGRLAQVKLGLLRQLRGDGVVEEEQQRYHRCRQQGRAYVRARHFAKVLCSVTVFVS